MLRGCLVSVIWKSKSIHSYIINYIQKLHDCSHIENVHLLFYARLRFFFFFIFGGLKLRHFFVRNAKMVSGLCNL